VDLGFQNNCPPFQRVSVHRIPVSYSPLHLCPCRDLRHASICELDSVCFVRSISRRLGRTLCAPQSIFSSSPEMGCTNGQVVQPDICICNLLPNSCVMPQAKLPLMARNCLALIYVRS
jgi:hypothetical protein